MEVETAARRMLLQNPGVVGYVGQKVFKYELLDHVNGTSGMAIVVRRSTGWAPPDEVQSSQYPALVVEFWADPDRDPVTKEKTRDNAIDKAYSLYRLVDPLLHRQRDVWWGAGGENPGLRVVTSIRGTEPYHSVAADSHGTGTPLEECAVVVAQYNLHI